MSDKSHIEWTDATWNPVLGCTAVSAGCANCYAARLAPRLARMGRKEYEGLADERHFTGIVRLLPERLTIPQKWKRPRRIFVNSMSDLFHPQVPFKFVDKVFIAMMDAPRHIYQILTKRPERMKEYFDGRNCAQVPDFIWVGTSIENQATADARIPHLTECPAAMRFLSCEPLLGPIEFFSHHTGINWIIAGGESGSGARPMEIDWVRMIRNHCAAVKIPFFFKQWGGARAGGAAILDGREHKEYPAMAFVS
jgi:protein gp37